MGTKPKESYIFSYMTPEHRKNVCSFDICLDSTNPMSKKRQLPSNIISFHHMSNSQKLESNCGK